MNSNQHLYHLQVSKKLKDTPNLTRATKELLTSLIKIHKPSDKAIEYAQELVALACKMHRGRMPLDWHFKNTSVNLIRVWTAVKFTDENGNEGFIISQSPRAFRLCILEGDDKEKTLDPKDLMNFNYITNPNKIPKIITTIGSPIKESEYEFLWQTRELIITGLSIYGKKFQNSLEKITLNQ